MKLQHPDSKQTIDVPADRAAVYESQGWREVGPVTVMPSAKAFGKALDAEVKKSRRKK